MSQGDKRLRIGHESPPEKVTLSWTSALDVSELWRVERPPRQILCQQQGCLIHLGVSRLSQKKRAPSKGRARIFKGEGLSGVGGGCQALV